MNELERHVRDYVAERIATGHVSAETGADLRRILGGMARHMDCTPADVTLACAVDWLASLHAAPRTVAVRTNTAKRFFGWLVEREVLARNPLARLEPPRVNAGQPRFLEVDEVRALLAGVTSVRTRAIIVCMVQMGLRRVEIHRAQVGDLDWSAMTFGVRGKNYGGEISRTLPIPDEAARALKEWYAVRVDSEHLFCTRTGAALDRNDITRAVTWAMRQAGVKRRSGDGKSAHALRHSFAQHLVDSDAPIRTVQHALGHKSVQTTEMYLRRQVDVLRDALEGRQYGD
jgi:site-specific recombinase XerC